MPPHYISLGSTGRQYTQYCQGASTKHMLRPSDKKYNYIIVVVQVVNTANANLQLLSC